MMNFVFLHFLKFFLLSFRAAYQTLTLPAAAAAAAVAAAAAAAAPDETDFLVTISVGRRKTVQKKFETLLFARQTLQTG